MTRTDLARAPHLVDPARRLRSGAWLLQRSWRHPQGLPAGWRPERFASSVDCDATLVPRPGRLVDTPLELAYVMRWIELDRGRALHDWRTLCERAP